MRFLLVSVCLSISPILSHATLIGDSVDYWRDYITGGGDAFDESFKISTATVLEGHEGFGWFDIEANSIHWAHQGDHEQIWPEENLNGFSFRGLDWVGAPLGRITGYSVEYGGNFRGNVSAGSNWVAFDFSGLGPSVLGDWMTVTLNVSHAAGSSVPDSGPTVALALLALSGLAVSRRLFAVRE